MGRKLRFCQPRNSIPPHPIKPLIHLVSPEILDIPCLDVRNDQKVFQSFSPMLQFLETIRIPNQSHTPMPKSRVGKTDLKYRRLDHALALNLVP